MRKAKLNKKGIVLLATVGILLVFSTLYFSNNMNLAKARTGKVDTSLEKVSFETLNNISMTTDKLASTVHSVSKGNIGSIAGLERAIVKNDVKEIDGHKRISESSEYQLYFLEDSLSIIIRDKKTGAILRLQ